MDQRGQDPELEISELLEAVDRQSACLLARNVSFVLIALQSHFAKRAADTRIDILVFTSNTKGPR